MAVSIKSASSITDEASEGKKTTSQDQHTMSSALTMAEPEIVAAPPLAFETCLEGSAKVETPGHEDEAEILAFLSSRPVHTIYMAGLIRDNGIASLLNRGAFFAYRNAQRILEGVALLGPKTVIESHTDHALTSLVELASDTPAPQLIRGEQKQIEQVLELFSAKGRKPRLVCRELLLEQRSPPTGVESISELRLATLTDLKEVIAINSMMAFEENGINPLDRDATGVSGRIARRIQQGREWVFVKQGRVIFKADVISEVPECTFIEGVYVHPEERGRGYGFRCMAELAHRLLSKAPSICLVVNKDNVKAQALYNKARYELHSHYRTVYF